MCRHLVAADIAGERKTAAMGTDVSFHLLGHIIQLDALVDKRHPEFPGLSRNATCSAKLIEIVRTQHPKTSLILSAGIAP